MDQLAKKAAELAISLKKLPDGTCGDDARLALLQQLALQIATEISVLRLSRPVGENRGMWPAVRQQ
jgi:hypothetical protein